MRYIVFLFSLFTVLTSQAQICPLCGIPNNFNIYATDYQADISWSNNSDAIYYEIRYQEDNGNNGIGNNWIYIYNIQNNQYSLTSLLPNTEYEFEVRSYCNSGYSYWSDDEEFETLNIIIFDCNNTPNGSAFIDNCGDCVGGNTNLLACNQDCNGDWGGNAIIDNCGNCTQPFENCINFSPNTNTSLLSSTCGDTTDLTIMFEQDQYEPDIQNSLFWSDAGTFIFQNINLGDTIGYGFLNTDGGNIMISTVFVVSSVINNNQLVISSIDTITNNNVGNFTIANLNPGIYITATSPGDNNNVTDGNYSMGVFENIFLNPSTPTSIEFTANINSELGDSDIQYEYIDVDCLTNIQTKETKTLVYPNPNKGVFNINTTENTNFTLYNLNGKIVFQEDLKIGGNLINISIQKGMYFADFNTQKETYKKKIIIH